MHSDDQQVKATNNHQIPHLFILTVLSADNENRSSAEERNEILDSSIENLRVAPGLRTIQRVAGRVESQMLPRQPLSSAFWFFVAPLLPL